MAGEFDFIDWIRRQQRTSEIVQVPAGDDLAVLKWNWPGRESDLLLVGVDQVLDGVHFDSAIHSPRAIGRKVMNRNLSDCAAMACVPVAALVSAALPRGQDIEHARELYLGIKEAADAFNCAIVGGETGSWKGQLVVTVTILGGADGIPPVKRGGAVAGEHIYVTGPLGGSLLLDRHMNFVPRIIEARRLASGNRIGGMIDLSDGLSRDLRQICTESRVGAIIQADLIPIHDDIMKARRDERAPLEHALHDGEDYELLFTTAEPVVGVECHRIGHTTDDPGIWLDRGGQLEPLEPKGWEHPL
jgi:thiamine-monophosphate kinase